ncbi:MAG TPA: GntR family transcriptional regulator [Chloroflexota bacterium]|nr:GntR family transcriptional regulator [Chloroflexota bacterium]
MPSPTIDRAGSVPMYRQLEDILRAELQSAGGAPRFTEAGLRARFGVSRYTVRQALDGLAREGLVQRQQKRGTTRAVRAPIEQPLEGVYSFAASMAGLGLAAASTVQRLRLVAPVESLRASLGLSAADRVVELVRVRSAEGEPLVIETVWLPASLVPGIQGLDLSGSVYELLRTHFGIEVTSAQESIRPLVLDARQARRLGVRKGVAALFVERVSCAGALPVEVRHSVIRGDRYLYSVRLSSPRGLRASGSEK